MNMPIAAMGRPLISDRERQVSMMISIGFLFLLGALFVQHTRFFDIYLSGYRIPAVINLACFVAVLASGRLMTGLQLTINKLWIGLLFWGLLSGVFGIWRSNSLAAVMMGVQSLALFWAVVAFSANSQLLLRGLKLIGLMASASAVAGLFLVGGSGTRLAYARGNFADPNEYSIWMMLGLPLLWLGAMQSKNFVFKAFYVGACAPILWAILKTGSRGALVALLVLALSIFVTGSWKGKVAIVVLILVGFFSFFLLLPQNLKDRYMTTMGSQELTAESAEKVAEAIGSRNERLTLFLRSIEETIKSPLFGVGPNNFGIHYSDLIKKERGVNAPSFTTHNTYTQLSSEMGIPGLMIFLAILFNAGGSLGFILRPTSKFNEGISSRTRECAFYLRLALIAIAVGSFFLSLGYSSIYYILTGLICSCRNVATDEMLAFQRQQSLAPPSTASTEVAPRKPIRVPEPVLAPVRNPVKFGRSRPAW
jgi:O-antigen ligase